MSDFEKELLGELNDVLDEFNEIISNTAVYGWNLVTTETPVITGRARAAWNVSVDSINNSAPPKVSGSKRIYPDPTFPDITFDINKNNSILITNNVDYIEYLEYGTDKFAPFAMVETAIPKIDRYLKKRLKGIK